MANETVLSGLHPGRDTLADAERRFRREDVTENGDSAERRWRDRCSGRSIRVELDAKNVIQTVTVSAIAPARPCTERPSSFLTPGNWTTGHGLRLGDSKAEVLRLYGPPDSSGLSTQEGIELQLLYYQFDWAGSNVTQVMEVLCSRKTGRVVEMTLAFPSL